MDGISLESVRSLLAEKLADRGDTAPLAETDPLFTTGRLDSMAAIEVMMLLESEFGIDLADADFEIGRIDTLRDMRSLVTANI